MNIDVALGCMRMLSNLGRLGYLDGLGISRGDFDRLVGDEPWLFTDRQRMTSLLHTLANSSLDAQGLPRFNMPAEYLAAAISIFVSPVNIHAACVYAPPAISAEDQGRGVSGTRITPEQLFGLVVQLYSMPGRSQARASFEKLTKLCLDKAEAVNSTGKSK